MLRWLFHPWERRLANETTDRIVRPFEWGLDWMPADGVHGHLPPGDAVEAWTSGILASSDAFYAVERASRYDVTPEGHLTFPSALETPHHQNNIVHGRYFPAADNRWKRPGPRRAVVVLPQWNSDREGHIGLARLLSHFGMSALRLSLPYHDDRMPTELTRADYIVSSNIVRTLQVCRQAVLDAKCAVTWLLDQGYERVGILGTSLGSCLAMLTTAHDTRIRATALNHVSSYFADVVWEGISTEHVRQGLDGNIDLEQLRHYWMPISPAAYVDKVAHARVLLVYAKYDLTFPLRLSKELVRAFRERGLDHEVAVLPCGHYSTGLAPFKWLDGYYLVNFLYRNL